MDSVGYPWPSRHHHAPKPIETLKHQVARPIDYYVKQWKLGVNTIQCDEEVIRLELGSVFHRQSHAKVPHQLPTPD